MSNITIEPTTSDLRTALAAGSDVEINAALLDLIASSSASGDARTIAQARAGIERLRTVEPSDSAHVTMLAQAVASLGHVLTRLRLTETEERNVREGGALARELLEVLDTPSRPKDLIEHTGADPAQIARSLRKLEASGDVERVQSPTGDARERWYARRQTTGRIEPVAQVAQVTVEVLRRRIQEVAPVAELCARGYITSSTDPHDQALDVARLYRVGNVFEDASFAVAARRSQRNKPISAAQIAWIACVRQKGESADVADYDRARLAMLAADIPRRLRSGPEGVNRLSEWLAECGVALVVEPGFSGGKLDGIAVVGANGQRESSG